jgi:hypothetical protein
MSAFSRDFDVMSDSERLRVTIDAPTADVMPRVLSLHGAGPLNRTRMDYLAAMTLQLSWPQMRAWTLVTLVEHYRSRCISTEKTGARENSDPIKLDAMAL